MGDGGQGQRCRRRCVDSPRPQGLAAGLSPKENRDVPPLDYQLVYALKLDFPDIPININGGVHTIEACREHLQRVDGVMLGRAAYQNPGLLLHVDAALFGDPRRSPTLSRRWPHSSPISLDSWRKACACRTSPATCSDCSPACPERAPGAGIWPHMRSSRARDLRCCATRSPSCAGQQWRWRSLPPPEPPSAPAGGAAVDRSGPVDTRARTADPVPMRYLVKTRRPRTINYQERCAGHRPSIGHSRHTGNLDGEIPRQKQNIRFGPGELTGACFALLRMLRAYD